MSTLQQRIAGHNRHHPTSPAAETDTGSDPRSDAGPPVSEVVRLLGVLTIRLEKLRGLAAGQLNIGPTDLRALYFIGAHSGITPKHVAGQLDVTTGSVTPILDRLEHAGFIERLPNPNDRRSMLLRTTPAGQHAREWTTDQYAHAVHLAIDSSPHLNTTLAVDLLAGLIASIDQIDSTGGSRQTR